MVLTTVSKFKLSFRKTRSGNRMPVGRREHPSVGRRACKRKIQAEVSSNRR